MPARPDLDLSDPGTELEDGPLALAFEPDGPTWSEALLRPERLLLLTLGLALLGSPALIASAGVLPTLGGVVAAAALGRVVAERSGIPGPGASVVLVGLAIAAGALFTRWSTLLSWAFALPGLVTAAVGTGLLLAAWSHERHGHEED